MGNFLFIFSDPDKLDEQKRGGTCMKFHLFFGGYFFMT